MSTNRSSGSRRPVGLRARTAACLLPILLAACGGGGDSAGVSCDVAGQQSWLQGNFNERYFWYALSPNPAPANFNTVDAYFDALLYAGGDAIPGGAGALWPSDRYSNFQSTESFERFFGDGQTLGYGVAVNGLEAVAQGAIRLYVRYVEPASPAALASGLAGGLMRGDEILAINSVPAASVIAQDDFSALTPNQTGDLLRLDIRRASGVLASVTLNAAVFALTPVQTGQVLASQAGRKLGYVFVKDMIDQAETPLSGVMTNFRNQGVQELVIDLRYNGGGFVSVGGTVASYAAGNRGSGQVYTRLLYSDRQSANNQSYNFTNPGAWAGFARAYVLMGERTCSASEQVINGLRGVGIEVVTIGDTTCGKPVGFNARSNSCGTTYSIVNFEGVNARSEGRYFNGFTPGFAVAEDFSLPIGDPSDPLLTAAAYHIDNGIFPVAAGREAPQSRPPSQRKRYRGADGGERVGMTIR